MYGAACSSGRIKTIPRRGSRNNLCALQAESHLCGSSTTQAAAGGKTQDMINRITFELTSRYNPAVLTDASRVAVKGWTEVLPRTD